MKKFISAASAMAMAASLVGSAIPFTTVAAEASKTLELRAFVDKDNKAVSTTISAADIAAGDVTIPVGLYYVEKTADTKSIRASFGVTSKDGDASKVLFGYDGVDADGNPIRVPYVPNQKYFNANQSVTIADGSSVDIANLVTWTGTMATSKKGSQFKGTGTYQCSLDTKQNSQNWDTAWGSLIWAEPYTGGYAWTGTASDSFPGFVFDCTFPKGTPAGTYTIEFINMVPDPAFPDVWSTMIESSDGGGVYTKDAGNLNCKSLTITIEGNGSTTPQPTEAPTKAPTATPTAAPTKAPTQGGSTGGSTDVQADFVVTGDKVKYEAGKETLMDFTVQSGGHKGAMIGFELADLPAGITAEVDGFCYAFDDMPAWEPLGEQWACKCMDPATSDPRAFVDGEAIISLALTVPSNIADGTYDIGLDYFHVVEQPSEKIGPIVEFDAKVVPGQLIVGSGASQQPTEAPTKAPTNGGSSSTQADFVVTGDEVTYEAGKDTLMDFTVKSGGHKGAMIGFELADLPAGITAEVDGFCYAFEDMPAWEPLGEQWACKCMDPATSDPRTFTDGEAIISLTLNVPADIKAGTYEIDLDYFHVVEQPSEKIGPIVEFDATVVPGKLIVGGGSSQDPTQAPTSAPQPTNAPAGDVLYGDANCNGKVDIADVVVLNKWLNDNSAYAMTAQGKINADCCDAKAGTPDENDSKAIIQSLVHLNDGKKLPWTAADLK